MAASLEAQNESLEDILSEEGLKKEDLDKVCSQAIRYEMAMKIRDWKMIGRCLEISELTLHDIEAENRIREHCVVALLEIWHKEKGRRATYRRLLRALYQRRRRDLMEDLCDMIKSHRAALTRKSHEDLHQCESESSVEVCLEILETRFNQYLDQLQIELNEKAISAQMLRSSLMRLTYKLNKESESSIAEKSPHIREAKSVEDLFLALGTLINFIDYHLIKHFVSTFGSKQLKADMSSYEKDVKIFMQKTTVGDVMHFWPGQKLQSEDFTNLWVKIRDDPNKYTLMKLNEMRNKHCANLKFSAILSAIVNITPAGSFFAVWSVPTVAVEEVRMAICQVDRAFYESEHVNMIILNGKLVYLSDSTEKMRSQDTCTSEGVHDFEEVKLKDVHIDHPSELLLSAIQHQEVEKVKFLLEDKDVEVDVECTDENGCTPLFIATMLGAMEIVKLLTDKKADVNAFDKNGKTVLMAAVESGNKELVEMYLDEHQCDVNVQEKVFGWSALHFAAKLGRTDIVTLLLRPDHNTEMLEDNDRNTAIDVAIKHDKVEVVKLLRSEAGIESGRLSLRKSKLIQAARKGLTDEVKRLLEEEKKNPNTVKGDRDGWTPLMYASHQGYAEIVELLLKHGADPDMQSSGEGWTALILASYRGFVEVVKLLLDYGCNVNIITKKKKFTALQRVCLYSQTRYIFMRFKPSERNGEVTKLLLDHGADITLLDFQNRTPLIAASRSQFTLIVKHILERLLSEDAEPKFSKEEQKIYLDKAMNHRWTALMEASEEGNAEIVHMLLEAGATPNKTKKDKESALHVAAYHGHELVVEMLAAKMKKEDINAKNEDGITPLMLAVKRKKTRIQEKIKIIDQLMEQGADITIQTDSNKTAMSFAQKFGNRDVIERIRYWGSATKEVTRGLTKEGVREVKRLMKGQRSEETQTAELPVS